MDTQNETPAPKAVDTAAAATTKVADAAATEAKTMTKVAAKAGKDATKVVARRAKAQRKPRAAKPAARPVLTAKAPVRRQARKPAAAAAVSQIKKDPIMNFDATNWMNNFTAVPGADRLQSMFAGAGERGQQMVERSQQTAGELVELTRANVEAMVESGRIAATGAQTLGQSAIARTREGMEQTAAQVKSLTQVQSPTEFLQLQGEIARTQFDRMVAESSRLAESMVKLAGEAFQPLSNRAALNAEKLNDITA